MNVLAKCALLRNGKFGCCPCKAKLTSSRGVKFPQRIILMTGQWNCRDFVFGFVRISPSYELFLSRHQTIASTRNHKQHKRCFKSTAQRQHFSTEHMNSPQYTYVPLPLSPHVLSFWAFQIEGLPCFLNGKKVSNECVGKTGAFHSEWEECECSLSLFRISISKRHCEKYIHMYAPRCNPSWWLPLCFGQHPAQFRTSSLPLGRSRE